jgi:hypothetical protein
MYFASSSRRNEYEFAAGLFCLRSPLRKLNLSRRPSFFVNTKNNKGKRRTKREATPAFLIFPPSPHQTTTEKKAKKT